MELILKKERKNCQTTKLSKISRIEVSNSRK